jgi:nucleoside 2-deoxyribosyltransferase
MSRTFPVRLYLAGPEVFRPNGAEVAARMRATCRALGLEPISPLDAGKKPAAGSPVAERSLAEVIFDDNIAMIERADAVVANMNHFRGPDPDAGTSFELGYGYARGKRCYVYSEDGATAVERVDRFFGGVVHREDGTPVDRDGLIVENFGGPFNLMLTASSTVVLGSFADAISRVAADVATGLFEPAPDPDRVDVR